MCIQGILLVENQLKSCTMLQNILQFVCIVQKTSSGMKKITIHSEPTVEKNLELIKHDVFVSCILLHSM